MPGPPPCKWRGCRFALGQDMSPGEEARALPGMPLLYCTSISDSDDPAAFPGRVSPLRCRRVRRCVQAVVQANRHAARSVPPRPGVSARASCV